MKIGGHPAVFLDVAARRFFLFGATFNAQDFWLVVLPPHRASASRCSSRPRGSAACGAAGPARRRCSSRALFRPIERWIEGPRERRLPRSHRAVDRRRRSGARSSSTGSTSLVSLRHRPRRAQPLPLREGARVDGAPRARRGHEAAFGWAIAVTGALYFNFAWFREQLCVARLPVRPAPVGAHRSRLAGRRLRREARRAAREAPEAAGRGAGDGDCVDCNRCVVVCPTGIDIRNGLQIECIACAQCIDACDDVMEKLGKPQGPDPLRLAERARPAAPPRAPAEALCVRRARRGVRRRARGLARRAGALRGEPAPVQGSAVRRRRRRRCGTSSSSTS